MLLLILFLNNTKAIAQNFNSEKAEYLIQNVNVVDVQHGKLLSDQAIVVSGGLIQSVTNSEDVNANDFSTVINAEGSFVIPGLWDMHAHMRADNLPPVITTEWLMPLMIANGVTGVRDMTSDCDGPEKGPVCLKQMKEWQKEIENGSLLGPRFLSLSSFQVNPPWDYNVTEEQVRQIVRMFVEKDVDLIKVYYRLSPQAYRWITDEANKLGIAVGGHIPLQMSVSEASEEGLRSLEHARDFLFDCFPGSEAFRDSARSQDPPIDVMHNMVDQYESSKCQDAFQVMVENDTWYVPTHVTRRMEAFADDPDFRNDPRNQYIPGMLLQSWNQDADRVVAIDSTEYGREAYMKFYRKGLEITGEAFQAGVRVLVGTDGGDSFVYPGFGVHDELQELVSAGLTPAEALRAATIHASEFLNLTDKYGTIESGKVADFILLEENPLTDIEHTEDIKAVIFRGEYLNRDDLNALLEKAKAMGE